MNAFWAVFLGVGGSAGIGSLGYTIFKDFRDRRYTERKLEAGVAIDEVTEQRIIAESAQINSEIAIAQDRHWKEQFDYIRAELTEEQKLRRRLTTWAKLHEKWDQRAWQLAVEADPDYPPPPTLEDL